MNEQDFIKEMGILGYNVDGELTPQMIGAENVYIFWAYPAEQEKFNWGKCNADF